METDLDQTKAPAPTSIVKDETGLTLLPASKRRGRPALVKADPNSGRRARSLRDRTRYWIATNLPEILEECRYLLKHAQPEDRARVQLACKLLDKILPDVHDEEQHRLEERPIVAIAIGAGLKRGSKELA
jgi:hypothetical protein